MASSIAAYNVLINAVVGELRSSFATANLLTPEAEQIFRAYEKANVASNGSGSEQKMKKSKKEKKPRYTGYLLFVKERSAQVRSESETPLKPTEVTKIVSPQWKQLTEEEKAVYNERAAEMKRAAATSSSSETETETDEEVTAVVGSSEQTPTKKIAPPEEAPAAPKKAASTSKKTPASPKKTPAAPKKVLLAPKKEEVPAYLQDEEEMDAGLVELESDDEY